MHVASHLYIPPSHKHTPHDHAVPHKKAHTQTHTAYTRKQTVSESQRTHRNIMMIPSIKFAPTEPSYPSLL